ncbi:DUF2542 family protein, partial [Salmonella enterica]|uniref:DUF2542 family protein n=1 Tax=Salmonella enterica TaxID=28901 RepID=UPI00398C82EB
MINDVQKKFVILPFLLLPLFCSRAACKGWPTAAVYHVLNNAQKPVLVYFPARQVKE